MTLLITAPKYLQHERSYIFKTILSDWLGVNFEYIQGNNGVIEISHNSNKQRIVMPDCFFEMYSSNWLDKQSLPELPLKSIDITSLGIFSSNRVDSSLPVIYGSECLKPVNCSTEDWLPIDIFGSSFFMLSRYEELVTLERDEHGRFSGYQSVAHKAGILQRPIIDEYVDLLKIILQKKFPGLEFLKVNQKKFITCDVDSAYSVNNTPMKIIRTFMGDTIKRKSVGTALHNLKNTYNYFLDRRYSDPDYHGISHIIESNERAGNSVDFYFISGRSHPTLDANYKITDKILSTLLRRLHDRGHHIGLHPSYNSFKSGHTILNELNYLLASLRANKIGQKKIGARQHFLRWDIHHTPHLYDSAKIAHDATLGYADIAGFRCGTSREYSLYNFVLKKSFSCTIRPLIIMECTVIAERYMGLGYSNDSIELMLHLKNQSLKYGGNFSLLWHNSNFNHPKDYEFYSQLIK